MLSTRGMRNEKLHDPTSAASASRLRGRGPWVGSAIRQSERLGGLGGGQPQRSSEPPFGKSDSSFSCLRSFLHLQSKTNFKNTSSLLAPRRPAAPPPPASDASSAVSCSCSEGSEGSDSSQGRPPSSLAVTPLCSPCSPACTAAMLLNQKARRRKDPIPAFRRAFRSGSRALILWPALLAAPSPRLLNLPIRIANRHCRVHSLYRIHWSLVTGRVLSPSPGASATLLSATGSTTASWPQNAGAEAGARSSFHLDRGFRRGVVTLHRGDLGNLGTEERSAKLHGGV